MAEYGRRLAAIQGRMAEAGMDVLLLTGEHDIRYVTGFFTPFWQSPTRPWFVVVPVSGMPEAVIPSIGRALMLRGFVGAVHDWPSPVEHDDGISLLAEVIRRLGGSQAQLGLPMGRETKLMMPLQDLEELMQALGDAMLVDATALMRQQRMIKSEAEIDKIRHACQTAGSVFAGLPGWVRQGMPLVEVFRGFRQHALAAGLDEVPYLVGGAGHGGYGEIIAPPDETPLQAGAVLMLDTGACYDGYFCDFDRNFAIGPTTAEAREAHQLLWQATEDALAAIRPGMTAAELFGIMAKRLGGGDDSVGRFGHGLGMQLTEPPSHISWDETVLEEGMVLTLEPSLGLGNGLMQVHEEDLVLRADGPQLLTPRASRELPQIG